jgi:hypothetical protein
MVYHIQTEDSGIEHPHIITHLFVEGTILSTKKTGYKEHVENAKFEDIVRGMMRDQHKTMFVELRDGVHDALSKQIFGDKLELPPEDPGHGQVSEPGAPSPEAVPDSASEPQGPGDLEEDKTVRIVRPAAMDVKEQPESESELEEQEHVGRSIFDTPDEDGEFGESLISDKSLDEVILSYLTDELDE